MARPRLHCSSVARRAATLRALACAAMALITAAAPLSAQRRRMIVRSHHDRWTLSLACGGSYALSDLEIVPGTDQNGGWAWDAGLRFQRGGGSIGFGYERLRLDVGPDGSATMSGIFAEPRVELGRGWDLDPTCSRTPAGCSTTTCRSAARCTPPTRTRTAGSSAVASVSPRHRLATFGSTSAPG